MEALLMPVTIPCASQVKPHLNHKTLWCNYCYYLTDKETKSQESSLICSESQLIVTALEL